MTTDAHAPGERVLSEEQRAYLETWARDAADHMGLRDWTIHVSAYIAREGSIASTFIRDAADEAELAVERDFAERTPDDQRSTLIHELLHPHFHRPIRLAFELLENELGKRTEAVIEAAVRRQEEWSIERLARAISPFFPEIRLP